MTFVNISSKCLNKAGMFLQRLMSNNRYLGLRVKVTYFLKHFTKKGVEVIKVGVAIIMKMLMGFINLNYAHGILL